MDRVAPAFEGVPPGPGPAPRRRPEAGGRVEIHRRPIEQVHLCLTGPGICITDERRYACSLLNSILGGNMSSRLFQTIRERHGLAYSIYSFVSSYEDAGMLGVYAAVAPEKTGETLAHVLAALGRLVREPVTAQRLAEAKEYAKGSLVLAAESNDNQMVRRAQNEIYFGRETPLSEVTRRIDRVGAADLMALARDLFRPQRLALTALGPVPSGAVPADLLQNWNPAAA